MCWRPPPGCSPCSGSCSPGRLDRAGARRAARRHRPDRPQRHRPAPPARLPRRRGARAPRPLPARRRREAAAAAARRGRGGRGRGRAARRDRYRRHRGDQRAGAGQARARAPPPAAAPGHGDARCRAHRPGEHRLQRRGPGRRRGAAHGLAAAIRDHEEIRFDYRDDGRGSRSSRTGWCAGSGAGTSSPATRIPTRGRPTAWTGWRCEPRRTPVPAARSPATTPRSCCARSRSRAGRSTPGSASTRRPRRCSPGSTRPSAWSSRSTTPLRPGHRRRQRRGRRRLDRHARPRLPRRRAAGSGRGPPGPGPEVCGRGTELTSEGCGPDQGHNPPTSGRRIPQLRRRHARGRTGPAAVDEDLTHLSGQPRTGGPPRRPRTPATASHPRVALRRSRIPSPTRAAPGGRDGRRARPARAALRMRRRAHRVVVTTVGRCRRPMGNPWARSTSRRNLTSIALSAPSATSPRTSVSRPRRECRARPASDSRRVSSRDQGHGSNARPRRARASSSVPPSARSSRVSPAVTRHGQCRSSTWLSASTRRCTDYPCSGPPPDVAPVDDQLDGS